MTRKKKTTKVKWQRNFSLVKYPDGKFVALTSYQAFALPEPVDKEHAYLFTPSKAEAYVAHYGVDHNLEIVSVNVYLE